MDNDSRIEHRITMNAKEQIESKSRGNIGSSVKLTIRDKPQKCEVRLHGLKAKILVKVKDENEKVVSEKIYPANSFLLNFMKMLYSVFTASSITAKDTNGNDVSMHFTEVQVSKSYEVEFRKTTRTVNLSGFQAWAIKEDDSHGIQIGTGTTSVSPDDYKLESQIPSGIGSGKMLYLSSEIKNVQVVGNTAHIELKRTFLNYSGHKITVNEVGLAVKQFSPETNILVIRDVVEATEVPNNYGLDISYVIEIAV